MEIAGQVVLITGGASGLGATTAQHLFHLGARIAIVDYHLESAEAMAESVDGLAIACDVSDEASVLSAIDQVVKEYGAIHVAVSCAGIAPAARIVGRKGMMDMAEFQRVIQVNLIGTVHIMRSVASQMFQQAPVTPDGARGVIINTASVAAFEGQIGQAAYASSKGGVVSLTLPAAREFAKQGVRVMTIAPGIMETPMMAGITEEYAERLASAVPFPHRLGLPDEYAQLVQSIIENDYLNGSVIRLDGALRMTSQ